MTKQSEASVIRYLSQVPLALGLERLAEAQLYESDSFQSPSLDLGCGDGLFASLLSEKSFQFGLDPDLRELQLGKIREPKAFETLLNNFGNDIPVPDKSLGTVISNSVLEHIENLDEVLSEVHRVLSDAGRFFVTIPTDRFETYGVISTFLRLVRFRAAERMWRKQYNRFWRHFHAYSPTRWAELLESNGFVIVRSFTYCPPHSCLRNDLLAHFALFSKLSKVTANRWILFPPLRKHVLGPLTGLFLKIASRDSNSHPQGGLIYFELRKSVAT